jgi:hypothetical protein
MAPDGIQMCFLCSYAFKNQKDNDFLVLFHTHNTSVMSVEIFHSNEDERDLFIYMHFLVIDFLRSW